MTFNIANEIQVQLAAKLEGFESQFVAFARFGSNAQEANARRLPAQNFARVNTPHDGVVREVDRFALNVGTGIQEHKTAVGSGYDRRDSTAIHPGNSPQLERGRGKNPA